MYLIAKSVTGYNVKLFVENVHTFRQCRKNYRSNNKQAITATAGGRDKCHDTSLSFSLASCTICHSVGDPRRTRGRARARVQRATKCNAFNAIDLPFFRRDREKVGRRQEAGIFVANDSLFLRFCSLITGQDRLFIDRCKISTS